MLSRPQDSTDLDKNIRLDVKILSGYSQIKYKANIKKISEGGKDRLRFVPLQNPGGHTEPKDQSAY